MRRRQRLGRMCDTYTKCFDFVSFLGDANSDPCGGTLDKAIYTEDSWAEHTSNAMEYNPLDTYHFYSGMADWIEEVDEEIEDKLTNIEVDITRKSGCHYGTLILEGVMDIFLKKVKRQ